MGYIINPYSYATTGSSFENLYSMAFDGVDDFISVAHNTSLDVVTANHSLSFWMKTSTGNVQVLMEKGRNEELAAFIINNKIYWGGSNGYYGGTTVVNNGNWYHIVFVADGSSSEIFINGSSVATGGNKIEASANTDQFIIGKALYGSARYNGIIDEVSIFNYALSSSNVSAIYNSGVPDDLTSYSPTAWYRMGD